MEKKQITRALELSRVEVTKQKEKVRKKESEVTKADKTITRLENTIQKMWSTAAVNKKIKAEKDALKVIHGAELQKLKDSISVSKKNGEPPRKHALVVDEKTIIDRHNNALDQQQKRDKDIQAEQHKRTMDLLKLVGAGRGGCVGGRIEV